MEHTKKLQDLEMNIKYEAISRKEINTKYGKSYILQVVDENKNEFELYSTKYITEYIDNEKPKTPFTFTVNEKYVKIENYSNGFVPFASTK